MRLGDCCKTNLHTYSDKEKWSLIRYLDTGSITEGRIDEIQTLYPGVDKIPSRARRKASVGDILFSTVRPNQKHYGIIEAGTENLLVSTGFTVVTVDTTIADPYFIYYYLTQSSVIESLQAIAEQSTSTYPSIKPSDIEDIELDLPELETQKKIGSTLRMLDRKIALNEEINDNLEQQAMALYRQMFVENNNDARRECRADECFDISIGKTPPRKEAQWFSMNPTDCIWVSISDMGRCGMYIADSSEYLTHESVDKFNIKVVPDNTVLLSFKLTVGRVAITDGAMVTNEAIAHFKTDKPEINEYLYCYLKDFNYQTMGSTSSIATAVNSKIIKAMPFVIPTDAELVSFHSATAPMFEMIKTRQRENTRLAELRDSLLPKLMSGEIDVSAVQL